ncbi:unnamed protein product [Oikopleura dioica]|uniref:protein-serine/threonine phosphatase n=1 Tax=Oikopleura dioica TaxID=34765 RepID=E4YPI6_OIKDI|nr:unnamed protein product [Oikopleura dioica]
MEKEDICHLSIGRGGVISPYSGRERCLSENDCEGLVRRIREALKSWKRIRLGIKLESNATHDRWLMLTANHSDDFGYQYFLVGLDVKEDITIGLHLPVTLNTRVTLDGDGAIVVTGDVQKPSSVAAFRPTSIQGLWSLYTVVCRLTPSSCNYGKKRPNSAPEVKRSSSILTSTRAEKNLWEYDSDLWSKRPDRVQHQVIDDSNLEIKRNIRITLKFVMSKMDLDIATPKQIQEAIVEKMPRVDLDAYKKYIDTEMLTVLGEMECSAKILDFLYLGSEWNAANSDELEENKITHILNVTKEIDNFYPEKFHYKNILLYDLEDSNLLDHWETTFRFIDSARMKGGHVLVHCKMGISRSASTVCAYLMKSLNWSLEQALAHVKKRRAIANPNDGFIEQLKIYEGMLAAQIFRDELDHGGAWPAETVSDTDLIEIEKSRVRKLVNNFHQRERAIRRSNSANHKKRALKMGRNGTALHDDEDIPPRLVLSHSEGESSSNEAEFRPNLRDISLSSVSEYPTSVVETSDVFDISHSLCSLSESDSDAEPSTNDSVVRLRRAGLVRLRTRQIEARIRRRNKRRAKNSPSSQNQTKQNMNLTAAQSTTADHNCHYVCHPFKMSAEPKSLSLGSIISEHHFLSDQACCLSESACLYRSHIYQSV